MLSSTALLSMSLAPATTSAHSATSVAITITSASAARRAVVVCALRDYNSIPKREPFSSTRSILEEFFKQEKPLVQRTKDQITGVSVRGILPVYHGECRLFPESCFLSNSPISGPKSLSLVCGASTNNHRPRNSDISRQQKRGSSRGKSKQFQERDDSENIDEFGSDTVFSKNGPPISLASNSRPQATSTPGEREKEIVELFKRVQAQLRARGKGREDKRPEPAKSQGERGSVDSLLNLLRKHSVDQRRKSSDEKEQSFDQTWRSNDSGHKQSSRIFGIKTDTQEGQKPPPAFQRPPSSFRRRSPVPGVKFQLVTNADTEASAKSIVNGMAGAVLKAKTPLEDESASDEPVSVSLYEPDSVISPENASMDDFVASDDESDALETDESNEYLETDESNEYLEPLGNADVTDSSATHDTSLEISSAETSDLNSLKVTELRELAKSRGMKGYSKMKKSELVEVLSNTT